MITINKKFDMIPREMDELIKSVEVNKPAVISFNVCGAVKTLRDVSIDINNGFLKASSSEAVDVIRYRDLCGWSVSDFKSDDGVNKIWDEADISELWDEMSSQPSTLSPAFLNTVIPYHIKKDIVLSFMAEYNGYLKEEMAEIIKDDEYLKDDYESYMEDKTYGELNDSFRCYLWDLEYPSHILLELFNTRVFKEAEELGWINDIISHHIPSILKDVIWEAEADD